MPSLWMWAELTICGGLYVLAGSFLVLRLHGDAGHGDIGWAKDFTGVLSALVLVVSYLTGVLVTRLQFWLWSALRLRFANKRTRHHLWIQPYDRDLGQYVRVWQYGSARLHHEIDSQYSVLDLCRSMTFAFPVCAAAFSVWAWRALDPTAAIAGAVLGVCVGGGFFLGFRYQTTHLGRLCGAADAELARKTNASSA